MAQFDAYRVTGDAIPFVVDIQSDHLELADTRVVIPLVRSSAYRGKTLASLNPVFDVDGVRVILLPTQTATVPRRMLRDRVKSLVRERDRIVRAIDTLLLGA
jgi:toxin CcdB